MIGTQPAQSNALPDAIFELAVHAGLAPTSWQARAFEAFFTGDDEIGDQQ